jgi:hypothetical protein
MNDIEFQQLREESWRRKLTAQEELSLRDYLATHSEARANWAEESALNQLLGTVPDAPVSTNFTTRVLQNIASEEGRSQRDHVSFFRWPRLRWIPKIIVGGAFVGAAIFSVGQYREAKRTEIARDISAVSQAATVPQVWLQDFEAIRHLSQPQVDDELLAALQ